MTVRKMYEEQDFLIHDELCGRGRRRTGKFLFIALWSLILLLGGAAASFAQSVLTDDAHVNCSPGDDDNDDGRRGANNGRGDTNCGAQSSLSLTPAGNIYIKFKLSSTLPVGLPGSDVARATLKLFISNVVAPGTIDVYQVAGAWSENTINANNAPPLGGLVASAVPIRPGTQGQF